MMLVVSASPKTNVPTRIAVIGSKTPNTEALVAPIFLVAILKKYENHTTCIKRGVLLPVPCNQNMNSYLKEIADVCGIQKHLSTHVARHSYATSVCLANGVSIENVVKMLGHSNIKMTQHYAKVLDSSILKDMMNVKSAIVNLG